MWQIRFDGSYTLHWAAQTRQGWDGMQFSKWNTFHQILKTLGGSAAAVHLAGGETMQTSTICPPTTHSKWTGVSRTLVRLCVSWLSCWDGCHAHSQVRIFLFLSFVFYVCSRISVDDSHLPHFWRWCSSCVGNTSRHLFSGFMTASMRIVIK